MELIGSDRARYFAPTAICVYLVVLCLLLIVTSMFLVNMQDAVAVTAAGLFGLLLSGGLGLLFWRAQRRDLLFETIATPADADSNFQRVLAAARKAGWNIVRQDLPRQIDAQASGSLLNVGERISVRFRDQDVLVASICDPSVGFSLVGRQHCRGHRDLVRRAVLANIKE
jgi:hypothetical protein